MAMIYKFLVLFSSDPIALIFGRWGFSSTALFQSLLIYNLIILKQLQSTVVKWWRFNLTSFGMFRLFFNHGIKIEMNLLWSHVWLMGCSSWVSWCVELTDWFFINYVWLIWFITLVSLCLNVLLTFHSLYLLDEHFPF